MSLLVECKADETLASALGIPRHKIEHFLGKGRVCNRLSRVSETVAMIDEDPGAASPNYLRSLNPVNHEHTLPLFFDSARKNYVVLLSPRLEEWLVQTAKKAALKLSDFGFSSDNGIQLHGEINQRLNSLSGLVKKLLEQQSGGILRLQSILLAKTKI